MPFIVKPTYEKFDADRIILTSEMKYRWKRRGVVLTVPAGFKSDLATIPAFLQWVIPPDGSLWALAAILHDWAMKQTRLKKPEIELTVAEADSLLYDGIRDLGGSLFTAWVFWLAVSLHHAGSAG